MDATSTTPPKRKASPDTTATSNSPVTPTKRRRNHLDEDVSPAYPSPKRHQRGVQLDKLYRTLEREYGFCLSDGSRQGRTLDNSTRNVEARCRNRIRFLWYRHYEDLCTRLQTFRTESPPHAKDIRSFALLLNAETVDAWQQSSLSSRKISRNTSATTSFASDFTRTDSAQTSFTSVRRSDDDGQADDIFGSWGDLIIKTRDFTPRVNSVHEPASVRQATNSGVKAFDAQRMSGTTLVGAERTDVSTKSGRIVDYHFRELPQRGLFVDDLPTRLFGASPRVRYECVRVSTECKVSLETLDAIYSESWENYSVLKREFLSVNPSSASSLQWASNKAWDDAGVDSECVIRTACFVFQDKSDPLMFRLKLAPLSSEATSCRFFRKFGSHRFLRLLIPNLKMCPLYHKQNENEDILRVWFQKWLNESNKPFMGYQWSVFYTKPPKGSKKKKAKGAADAAEGYTVYLFATTGAGIPAVSIAELLNWFLPFHNNRTLPYCKAYARFELGLSMTRATLIFKPSQVRPVRDTFANGQAEDPSLNDQRLRWKIMHNLGQPKVMNDGCARISPGAAKVIWTKLNGLGPCPSVFQGRIGPWKGIWFIDSTTTDCSDSSNIWLEVTDSQRKFERHADDLDDSSFDPRRLTFEVVSWSHKPSISSFYLDYFPILEDRGVSRANLSEFVIDCLNQQKKQLIYSLGSANSLLKWIEETWPVPDKAIAGRVIMTGAMPSSKASKAMRLLESGFRVTSCSYLGKLIQVLITNHFTDISSSLDIAIPQSTFVYGIADPLGCLGPSEIHLAFSSSPSDEVYPYLHGIEALVARHPAMRRSDIQKVKAVFKPELRHLVDVVVFPTTGSFPLAGKLQGGDYDGDRFWICWHQTIVKPFLNAPPPYTMKPPEDFGITVDRAKIGDIFTCVGNSDATEEFLARSFKFAWQEQTLGICTNFMTNLCYMKNSISSSIIDDFADLHDYLVGSTKNGYLFTGVEWSAFRARFRDIDIRKMKSPAFRTASDTPISAAPKRISKLEHQKANIIDHLVFDVARPHALGIVHELEKLLKLNEIDDVSLRELGFSLLNSNDETIKEIMKNLKSDILSIHGTRKQRSALNLNLRNIQPQFSDYNAADPKLRDTSYEDAISEAHIAYKALLPRASSAPTDSIRHWLARPAPHAYSYWDCVKASAVSLTKPDFAFGVAGDVLCYMKAHSDPAGPPRSVVGMVYKDMKMRKIRAAGEGRGGLGRGNRGG